MQKASSMERPSSQQKDWSESGSCPVLGFRDRLPGGPRKQSRTPAAGRLDSDADGEAGIQRGGRNHRDDKSLVTGTRKEAGVRSTGRGSEAESLAQVPPKRASS